MFHVKHTPAWEQAGKIPNHYGIISYIPIHVAHDGPFTSVIIWET